MLSFNMLISAALILRVIFVIYGALVSLIILGKEDLKFILSYVTTRAFQAHKFVVWVIAFGTLLYFKHLISNAEDLAISAAFDKNIWISSIVILLLVSVNIYAFLDAKKSINSAKEIKNSISRAWIFKRLLDTAKIGSWFTPHGLIGRIGVWSLVYISDSLFDNYIENQIMRDILKNISALIILALINVTMIILATYLITDQILFW